MCHPGCKAALGLSSDFLSFQPPEQLPHLSQRSTVSTSWELFNEADLWPLDFWMPDGAATLLSEAKWVSIPESRLVWCAAQGSWSGWREWGKRLTTTTWSLSPLAFRTFLFSSAKLYTLLLAQLSKTKSFKLGTCPKPRNQTFPFKVTQVAFLWKGCQMNVEEQHKNQVITVTIHEGERLVPFYNQLDSDRWHIL